MQRIAGGKRMCGIFYGFDKIHFSSTNAYFPKYRWSNQCLQFHLYFLCKRPEVKQFQGVTLLTTCQRPLEPNFWTVICNLIVDNVGELQMIMQRNVDNANTAGGIGKKAT